MSLQQENKAKVIALKTPQIGMETFLDLFDPDQITQIRKTHHTTNFWMHAQNTSVQM